MSTSAKLKKISLAKKGAPKVPGDTCPSINYVQEVLEQITARVDDDWASKQREVVDAVLEYIRDSNEELRASSYYWYKKYEAAV
mgnify:CR=1 FL=1